MSGRRHARPGAGRAPATPGRGSGRAFSSAGGGAKASRVLTRRGRRADSAELLKMLRGLAEYEKLEPPSRAAERRLVADIFEKGRLGLFVASERGRLVGYALYFFSYSSFLARPTLYLEDIFVLKDHRGRGAGSALFRRCMEEAVGEGCGRMEWAVLAWNRAAIGFYERLGAASLDEWRLYRLTREQLLRSVRRRPQMRRSSAGAGALLN